MEEAERESLEHVPDVCSMPQMCVFVTLRHFWEDFTT